MEGGYRNRCGACKKVYVGVAQAFGLPQRLSKDARRERQEQMELEGRGQQSFDFA